MDMIKNGVDVHPYNHKYIAFTLMKKPHDIWAKITIKSVGKSPDTHILVQDLSKQTGFLFDVVGIGYDLYYPELSHEVRKCFSHGYMDPAAFYSIVSGKIHNNGWLKEEVMKELKTKSLIFEVIFSKTDSKYQKKVQWNLSFEDMFSVAKTKETLEISRGNKWFL